MCGIIRHYYYILLTKVTAVQNEVALSYHKVRGLYFLAVVIAEAMFCLTEKLSGKVLGANSNNTLVR